MPVLDALALDADLRLLSSGQQPSSPAPAEYQRLRALFDPVRNIYVTGFPFLIADHLAMRDASQASIIRKANQAMFCSAIYAGGIGQLALDQAFLDIFVPENGQLLQVRSNIWLELKTQGFMTAMRLKAAPPNQVMSDLFPAGIESRIVARHPTSKTLTASEQDFAARYEARRKILFEHISRNALPELDQKFTYVELANQVANFLIMTYGVGSKPVSQTTGIPANGQRQGQMGNNSTQAAAAPAVTMPELPTSMDSLPSFDSSDFIELAARAAAIAMRGTASPMSVAAVPGTQPSPAIQSGPHVLGQTQVNPMPGANGQHGSSNKPYVPLEPSDTIPHASQSAPTHVLYQRARAAEPIKSTTPGTPRADGDASQQRRPWSEEEERALMDGLDRVQGPHWANIMALHGPGGSLSETLKERNQVQLKDKARNLKLFFLKNKIEAPYYLSQVTGTLETRAPGQAEKLETETAGQAAKEPSADDAKVQIVDQAQDDAMEDVKIENEAQQQLRDGSLPNVASVSRDQ
jgi:protein TBF1